MMKLELGLVKKLITGTFGILNVLVVILLIQEPKSIGSYALLVFCICFDTMIYFLFFEKDCLLYKRFHEKSIDEDD